MLRLFMVAESASADMAKRTVCTVKDCTYPRTHHHLDELEGQSSFCDGSSDEYDRVKTCCELGPLFDPNLNPAGKCQGFFDCKNDAIGVVSRDPYDYVSRSPLVTPRACCLNCYNERVLSALEFIRGEKSR